MKKYRFLIFALLLALQFAFSPLLTRAPNTAAAQQQIPPECVESCRQLMFECIAAGEGNRCIAVYRSCVARCR